MSALIRRPPEMTSSSPKSALSFYGARFLAISSSSASLPSRLHVRTVHPDDLSTGAECSVGFSASVPFDFALSAMAARSDFAPARWRKPFLIWLDGIEAGWAIPVLLVCFVTIWMIFLQVAYLSGDLHPDVLETWSLGREFAWGNSKHPPLMGWMARAWTSFFPLSDWSFQLMAMINSAAALWAVDLISRQFVRGDKRVVILLLLLLLPTYQFHAQRFNANTALLAVWPLATYCFLRSFQTRQIRWAAAAGVTAAVAMLGKYYSVFLLGSFGFAALCHPQRRYYFASSAPWVSIAVGLIVLAPHLHWLATTGAGPFSYAIAAHGGRSFDSSLNEATYFLVGLAATLAIPAITWAMIAGYRLRSFPSDFRQMSPSLWLLFLIAIGTIVIPVVTGVALGADLPPLWALQGLFLFVILIVCGASYPIERFYSVNLTVMVLGFAVIATAIAAPIHAVYRNIYAFEEGRNFYRMASLELTGLWHERFSEALSAVGGDENLAFAAAFYSPDHPVAVNPSFQEHLEMARQPASRGWAAMCFHGDAVCLDGMGRIASNTTGAIQKEFVIQSMLFGWPGATRNITAFIVPPSRPKPN